MNKQATSLKNAPQSVQIAVDLIQLLEENKIENNIVIEALEIVLADFKRKRN